MLSGRCSCGCFGSLCINPWYVLAFDLAVVVLLLRLRPVDRSSEDRMIPTRALEHYRLRPRSWVPREAGYRRWLR